jgi:hypothetical protein
MFTYTDLNNIVSISENYVGDFALGLSVGWKFVTRNGFTTEAYFGVGRNLLNKEYTSQLVLRGGLALGYRF